MHPRLLKRFFQNNIMRRILLFFVFLLLTLWFTKIPMQNIGSVLPDDGDPRLVSWLWSWEMHILPTNPLNLFNANIFAPYQNTLAFTDHMLGSLIFAWPLELIFHNIFLVFNLVCLLSFVISGLGMHLLARYFTRDKIISLLAAFIYAFAPFKLAHLQHINLSGLWLPFFLLSWHRFFEEQNWKNTWLLLLFTTLVFLGGMQYFLFIPLVIIILLFKYLANREFIFTKKNIIKFSLAFIIFLALAVPLTLPYLQVKHDLNLTRSLGSIEGLSPDLFDYFISPFFYHYFYPVIFVERIVGPGIFVLILFGFALWFLYKKTDKFGRILPYLIIGLIAVLLSCGYYIQLTRAESGGMIGPWALFYHFAPGFSGIRAVGRYSIFFLISACVIITVGLNEFFKRKKFLPIKKNIVIFIIFSLIFTEFNYAHLTKKQILVDQKIPEIYNWVKDQSDERVYLELPLGLNYQEHNYDVLYEFYSIYHFKKIVNGYSGFAPKAYEELSEKLINFDFDGKKVKLIKAYGATHIIFHFDYYPPKFKEKIINQFQDGKILSLEKFAGNDYVYKIL